MISVTFAVRPSIIGPHLFPCHTSFMNSTENTALRFEQLTYEVSLHQNIGQDRLFREWTEDAQDCNSRPAVSYLHSFFLEQNIQSLRCCPSSKRVMQGRHAIRNRGPVRTLHEECRIVMFMHFQYIEMYCIGSRQLFRIKRHEKSMMR